MEKPNPCGCDPSLGLPRKSSIGDFCCDKSYKRAWNRANRDRVAAHSRGSNLAKFGLTVEDYDQMLAEQDSVCAICGGEETAKRAGRTKRLAVDHCHATGAVRGLLCQRCNTLVGLLEPDPSLIDQAMAYIRTTEEGRSRPEAELEIMARLGRTLAAACETEGIRTLAEMIRFARIGRDASASL